MVDDGTERRREYQGEDGRAMAASANSEINNKNEQHTSACFAWAWAFGEHRRRTRRVENVIGLVWQNRDSEYRARASGRREEETGSEEEMKKAEGRKKMYQYIMDM